MAQPKTPLGPFSIAQKDALNHRAQDVLLFRTEPAAGFELELQVVAGTAIIPGEKKHIRAHAEHNGKPADGFGRGFATGGFHSGGSVRCDPKGLGQRRLG
jgi:hypothetical protein